LEFTRLNGWESSAVLLVRMLSEVLWLQGLFMIASAAISLIAAATVSVMKTLNPDSIFAASVRDE
jgi:hypothetical protein